MKLYLVQRGNNQLGLVPSPAISRMVILVIIMGKTKEKKRVGGWVLSRAVQGGGCACIGGCACGFWRSSRSADVRNVYFENFIFLYCLILFFTTTRNMPAKPKMDNRKLRGQEMAGRADKSITTSNS